MQPGYGQQGYPQQGYGPPPGYGPPGYGGPPPPPPKKGMSGGMIALLVIVGLFVLGGGSCVVCAAIGVSAGGGGKPLAGGGRGPSAGAAPAQAAPNAMQVEVRAILSAYKGNEIAADNSYKGKLVQVNGGLVDDIKKDILDQPFVTLGTGAAFEIPQIQCTLRRDQAGKAATLQKGQRVTVRGEVKGLMFNVQLDDCEIL